jgi:hypothetical protein
MGSKFVDIGCGYKFLFRRAQLSMVCCDAIYNCKTMQKYNFDNKSLIACDATPTGS